MRQTRDKAFTPGGQAFVLFLQSAYRDYASLVASGATPISNSTSSGTGDDDNNGTVISRCRLVRHK
ncbi:hypothetical protein C8R42DRAFT_731346 [Lentinula raphanica]|nr:hypothetical protein C8R42DRAFT_731346 [Lentinula raphanica]